MDISQGEHSEVLKLNICFEHKDLNTELNQILSINVLMFCNLKEALKQSGTMRKCRQYFHEVFRIHIC